ncbi:MAG: hypothetical protein AAF226_09510, partial [Verrucomicrobiota bacterium]
MKTTKTLNMLANKWVYIDHDGSSLEYYDNNLGYLKPGSKWVYEEPQITEDGAWVYLDENGQPVEASLEAGDYTCSDLESFRHLFQQKPQRAATNTPSLKARGTSSARANRRTSPNAHATPPQGTTTAKLRTGALSSNRLTSGRKPNSYGTSTQRLSGNRASTQRRGASSSARYGVSHPHRRTSQSSANQSNKAWPL